MNMNLFRIYDRPCGSLLCTVACCSDSPAANYSVPAAPIQTPRKRL